jgi:quinolinate synthase
MGDQAVPAGHTPERLHKGVIPSMLRLQKALPDRYTTARPDELSDWIGAAKAELGSRVFILGHHYQRDEVMRWADARGDSFGLSRMAADQSEAEFVVFCGVHFMAESADILTGPHQQVILPDLNAGCSMADMADIDSVEEAWESLAAVTDIDRVVPVTYMNSAASLKAFVGAHGGVVCTSSNARAVLTWALGADGSGHSRGDQVLFFPDQHLGRNTGFELGYGAEDMAVWNPRLDQGGLDDHTLKSSTLLLWKGHCSVHQRFSPAHVEAFRSEHPGGIVVAHPECSHEVVEVADLVGSTDFIIRAVAEAPPGSVIGVGTEIHLVKRLDDETPDKTVVSLDPLVCPCSTMFRVDAAHLAWVLEGLVAGEVHNRITVDEDTATWARVALERMLATV